MGAAAVAHGNLSSSWALQALLYALPLGSSEGSCAKPACFPSPALPFPPWCQCWVPLSHRDSMGAWSWGRGTRGWAPPAPLLAPGLWQSVPGEPHVPPLTSAPGTQQA